MIIVNFKNYKFEKQALALAKQIQKFLPKAIVCPPAIDLESLASKTKLKVFAQSTDTYETDRATGFNTLPAIKKAGATGTLINHSEHLLPMKDIYTLIKLSNKLNLKSLVCIPNLKNIKKIISQKPWAIAFEDPKLISTGKSVTQYNPKAILEFVKIMKRTKIIPICGAGIS